MALALAHLAPWDPKSNLAARVNRAINDRPAHTAGCHLLSATNNERLQTQISQWSQIKEDTVEPTVLARDIILLICT